MGMYAEAHRQFNNNIIKLLDWTNEEDTLGVLKLAAASAVGVCVVVMLVPVNLIMLVGGCTAFVANTAFVRAASSTLPPVILKGLQERVDTLSGTITKGIEKASVSVTASGRKVPSGGKTVTVKLYENQRWWAGLGWIPHLLKSERQPWSDDTGAIAKTAKETFPLPSDTEQGSWSWADPEWRLDMGWEEGDEMGWVYSDHNWEYPKNKANTGSLTRRRLWVRDVLFTPKKNATGTALSSTSSPSSVVEAAKTVKIH